MAVPSNVKACPNAVITSMDPYKRESHPVTTVNSGAIAVTARLGPIVLSLRRPCGTRETLLLLLQELRDLARLVYRELLYLTVLRAGKGI